MESKLQYALTHFYKIKIIAFLKKNPQSFDELIGLAISDKEPYTWKAAWMLWTIMNKNDSRIQPYVKNILERLPLSKENHQRELLLVLQQMEIEDKYLANLFNICLKIWMELGKKPAVRFRAFQMMIKISKKYPELKNEIISFADSYYTETLSPGIRNSVAKHLKTFNEVGG